MSSRKIRKWWTEIARFSKKFINPTRCMCEDESNIQIVLKIATHASNVMVLYGTSSGLPSTDTNSMGSTTPSFKHFSLNSARNTSAWKSSAYEAAKLLLCFPLWISMYVGWLKPIEPCVFQMQHKQMWSIYAFPQLESHDLKSYSIIEVHQNRGLLFWYGKTKRHSCLAIRRKEKYIFIRKSSFLACLRAVAIVTLGKLNWNNLDIPLCIAMCCILWKQPEKIKLWQWMQRENSR